MQIINYFDSVNMLPGEEYSSAFDKIASVEYYDFYSLEGHAVCVLKAAKHALNIILKPVFYFVTGIIALAMAIFGDYEQEEYDQKFTHAINNIACGFVAIFSETVKTIQALAGIFHPGVYFEKDEFAQSFRSLAEIGTTMGLDMDLNNLLYNGSEIINQKLNHCYGKEYYKKFFLEKITFIASELSKPEFSAERAKNILLLLKPDTTSDLDPSGINSCPPGFGRLLEQICLQLSVPADSKEILHWVASQHQQEVINLMLLQSASTAKPIPDPNQEGLTPEERQALIKELMDFAFNGPSHDKNDPKYRAWHELVDKVSHDNMHRANALVNHIGEAIGLPQSMLDYAQMDLYSTHPITEEEKKQLIEVFFNIYNEKYVVDFLLRSINSGEDGSPGMKKFRGEIIVKLSEMVTPEVLEQNKAFVGEATGCNEQFQDDPSHYVRAFYHLHPKMIDSSSEKYTDLNEIGLRAYCATLGELNPFNCFNKKS